MLLDFSPLTTIIFVADNTHVHSVTHGQLRKPQHM